MSIGGHRLYCTITFQLITEQEHSCIIKIRIDGSFLEIQNSAAACFFKSYDHSHQKTQRRGSGLNIKMDKISSSKHRNQNVRVEDYYKLLKYKKTSHDEDSQKTSRCISF